MQNPSQNFQMLFYFIIFYGLWSASAIFINLEIGF